MRFTEEGNTNILKGTTLEVYRLLLRTKRPLGIRDVQRALNLSSPSIAQYHMSKLEQAGLLKHKEGNWVINRVELDNCIKINRFLIPRHFLYTVFALLVLIGGFSFFRSPIDTVYVYFMAATTICVLIFSYETVKAWLGGKI